MQKFFNLCNLVAFLILTKETLKTQGEELSLDSHLASLLDMFSEETAEEYLRNNNFLYYWRHVFDLNTIDEKFPQYEQRIKPFLQTKNREWYLMDEFLSALNVTAYKKMFSRIIIQGFVKLE